MLIDETYMSKFSFVSLSGTDKSKTCFINLTDKDMKMLSDPFCIRLHS